MVETTAPHMGNYPFEYSIPKGKYYAWEWPIAWVDVNGDEMLVEQKLMELEYNIHNVVRQK